MAAPIALRFESHEEWLDIRRRGIGGSDVGAILGLNKYRTPLDVYFEKRGEVEPEDLSDNDAVHFGIVLEDVIAAEYERRTGRKVRRNNRVLQHPKYPWMLANLDREVVGRERILECKTAGAYMAGGWGESGTDQVPESYLLQCMHYLAVTGRQVADLAVLIGGRDFRIYEIRRDEELIQMLIEREAEFWARVERGDPPAPLLLQDVSKLFPRHTPDKEVEATPDVLALLQGLRDRKDTIKRLKEEAERLQMKISEAMGDAERLVHEGMTLATWKAQASSRFDSRSFKADHPDMHKQYCRQTQSRVFRLA